MMTAGRPLNSTKDGNMQNLKKLWRQVKKYAAGGILKQGGKVVNGHR
jgi:hypothetical protein